MYMMAEARIDKPTQNYSPFLKMPTQILYCTRIEFLLFCILINVHGLKKTKTPLRFVSAFLPRVNHRKCRPLLAIKNYFYGSSGNK